MMVIMNFDIRVPRSDDEAEQSRRLGHEAFGFPAVPPTEPARLDHPGATQVVAMDGPTVAARMVDRDYQSWFGGRLVPTSGIGGVTVAMEYRGRKLLQPMFEELFRIARDRGAVISTLYPSSAGIYRRLGYEVITTAEQTQVPTAALARLRPPAETGTRRATVEDVPAIREIYDLWAAGQNGPLSRRGVSFPTTDAELVSNFTGLTVAERDGRITGYASWNRGSGFGATAALRVFDLIATEADGYRALLSALGSFTSIAGQVALNTSGLDLVQHLVPTSDWQVTETAFYMLKIIDVPGAFTSRGYPTGLSADLEFGVTGDPITGIDGRYRLQVTDGKAECTRLGDLDPQTREVPVFTPNGLAIAYAGSQSWRGIRTVGGLTGPTDCDALGAALFSGNPVRIHDHF